MSIDNFLSKLSKVRRRGGGQWMASCPCHEDKTPSLSIKDDNGTILIHCFGCGAGGVNVCGALGIDPSELFPPSDNYDATQPRQRRPFHDAAQVLEHLAFEALVLHVIGNDMLKNGSITPDERERLAQASVRVNAALEYVRRIIS